LKNTNRVYAAGLIGLAMASLKASSMLQKFESYGLRPHDLHFSKDDHGKLEVMVTSQQAFETIAQIDGLPASDAPLGDAHFFHQRGSAYVAKVSYEDVVATMTNTRDDLSKPAWNRIVDDLVASTVKQRPLSAMPKTADKKVPIVGKVGETV